MTPESVIPDPFANVSFNAIDDAVKEARADQGFGYLGVWPGMDEHKGGEVDFICAVGVVIKTDAVYSWGKRGKQTKVPAMSVRFTYEAELPEAESTFPFQGNPMTIPYDIGALPDKSKKDGGTGNVKAMVTYGDLARLKGSLKGLLSYEVDSEETLKNALREVLAMISAAEQAEREIRCKVKLRFPVDSWKTDEGVERSRTDQYDHIIELTEMSDSEPD